MWSRLKLAVMLSEKGKLLEEGLDLNRSLHTMSCCPDKAASKDRIINFFQLFS